MSTASSEYAQVLAEFVERYYDDPVAFVQNVFQEEPDDWQAQVLTWLAGGERRISVRSGHGVGKTATLGWAAVWLMMTRSPVKVIVTAPSAPQLFDALFAEIKKWCARLPPALQELLDVKAERIEHKAAPAEMFISARTSRAESPDAMQGVHAEGGVVLLVADEAAGIPEPVFEAASGSMSGENCATVLLGNPTRLSGLFFDTHHSLRDQWRTLRVSCVDSKRVSRAYLAEMADRYGEESNAYRVRVLGEFPLRDDDTVISLELAMAARDRDIAPDPQAQAIWGLDVARFGNDSSALTKRLGKVVSARPQVWRNLDTMQLSGAVKAEFDAAPIKPIAIIVDVIGIGSGVVDRLREMKLPVIGINVSESPSVIGAGGMQFADLRSQLWYQGKAWLEQRDCKLPEDERLVLELAGPKYAFLSSGKVKVESKADMKKRGLRSPDVANSFLLTFAHESAYLAGAAGLGGNWSRPLKRKIGGIV